MSMNRSYVARLVRATFLPQSRAIRWKRRMAAVDYEAEYNYRARVPGHADQTRYQELPGNHFTVIDSLADPSSAMVTRIAELTKEVSR